MTSLTHVFPDLGVLIKAILSGAVAFIRLAAIQNAPHAEDNVERSSLEDEQNEVETLSIREVRMHYEQQLDPRG